jgi:RNA polymerase sigma-B factor
MTSIQTLPSAPSDRADEAEAGVTASPAEQERRLLRRVHLHGDMRARDQLVESMLPLARALARRYTNRGEPLDDLVQVACIGVVKAIDGFDIARSVRLASYATPTVLGEIKRHFRDRTWLMRVPRPMKERHLRVVRARDSLTDKLGRAPAVHEIAASVDETSRDVAAAMESAGARRARSFDEPVGDNITLADSLGAVDPEIERAELRALLGSALDVLSQREQDILHMRFDEDFSQTEIAERLGISQMQVSRLIAGSLARVRLRLERRTRVGPRQSPRTPISVLANPCSTPCRALETEPAAA